jgi:hypothetical protein
MGFRHLILLFVAGALALPTAMLQPADVPLAEQALTVRAFSAEASNRDLLSRWMDSMSPDT